MPHTDVTPTSASIASTGLGIRYIGKEHCYAFSGGVAALNTEQTVLDFTTGSGYIIATLTMTAPIRLASIGVGLIRGYELDFNGQTVGLYKLDSVSEDMPSNTEVQILIPPITAVVLTCQDDNSDATYFGTANITGRVYGAV